jgi:hypothetical protein
MLLGKPLAAGLSFTLPNKGETGYDEALPWIELLQKGTFDESKDLLPVSYQTTDRWLAVLEKSVAAHGMSWLHALHLGTAYAERGNIDGPKDHFNQSFSMKPNPLAARNLAVLSSTPEEAWPYWQLAWNTLHSGAWSSDPAYKRLTNNLITEMSFFLQQELWYNEMIPFINDVMVNNRLSANIDAFTTMIVKLAINFKQWDKARGILATECFPTYAKARSDLMAMWNTVSEGIAEAKKGSVLTNVEKHQARLNSRIPDNIGCQYASEYCTNYW